MIQICHISISVSIHQWHIYICIYVYILPGISSSYRVSLLFAKMKSKLPLVNKIGLAQKAVILYLECKEVELTEESRMVITRAGEMIKACKVSTG